MNSQIRNISIFYFVHFLLLIVGYLLLYKLGIASVYPNNTTLLNWDASWYFSIQNEGYSFLENTQSNTGFFPLFPVVWKGLSLSPIGIAILNGVFFSAGATLLTVSLKKTWKELVILVSLPSIFFFYLPYSEALFYLVGCIILVGLQKQKMNLFYGALFVACMVRPVLFFFIPALIVLYVLRRNNGFSIKKFLLSILIILIATSLSFWIVGYSSNDFFAYSKSQVGNWDHVFSMPGFPLTTWRGYRMLWLDGVALFIIGIIGLNILKVVRNQILEAKLGKSQLSSTEVFASIGLVMTFFYVVFFHLEENGRTSLMSFNRYILCSPLLHFLILNQISKNKFTLKSLVLPFTVGILTIVLLGFPYTNVVGLSFMNTIVFLLLLLILCIGYYLVILKKKYDQIYTVAFYCVNIFLQLYLMQSFLKGNWVG